MTWRAPAHATNRLRLTVFAHPSLVTDASLAGGSGVCDEIALLRSISNDDHFVTSRDPDLEHFPLSLQLSDTVTDPRTPNKTTPNPLRSPMLASAIFAAHKARMQILAGYALVDGQFKSAKRFNAWLRSLHDGPLSANRDAEIERFVRLISDWLDLDQDPNGGGAFFDGISFDIESVAWWPSGELSNANDPAKAQDIGKVLARFYSMLADVLRGKTVAGTRSQFVAVAGGGLIDATSASHGVGGTDPSAPKLAANFSTIAHGYQMADSRVNMVLRPMMYDNFDAFNPTGDKKVPVDNTNVMDRWHRETIDYALSENGVKGASLKSYQFQLSIKLKPGASNSGSDKDHNLDGVMSDPAWVTRRAGELRNRGVGLCLFAFGGSPDFWANVRVYDDALNPKPAPKAPVMSEPSQCPHDELSIKLVKP